MVGGLTAAAQLMVWHTEHCTWLAPRGYISTTRQFWFVHTSCAISPPAQRHGVLSACEAKDWTLAGTLETCFKRSWQEADLRRAALA